MLYSAGFGASSSPFGTTSPSPFGQSAPAFGQNTSPFGATTSTGGFGQVYTLFLASQFTIVNFITNKILTFHLALYFL